MAPGNGCVLSSAASGSLHGLKPLLGHLGKGILPNFCTLLLTFDRSIKVNSTRDRNSRRISC
jgi:hypothetical protein